MKMKAQEESIATLRAAQAVPQHGYPSAISEAKVAELKQAHKEEMDRLNSRLRETEMEWAQRHEQTVRKLISEKEAAMRSAHSTEVVEEEEGGGGGGGATSDRMRETDFVRTIARNLPVDSPRAESVGALATPLPTSNISRSSRTVPKGQLHFSTPRVDITPMHARLTARRLVMRVHERILSSKNV